MIGARDAVPGRSDLVASMERLLAIGGVPVERRFVPMGDGALHVLEAGKGDPLVLLHGAGGGAANWFSVIEGLTDRFRLLAPDLPGFGLSDPIDPTSPLGDCVAQRLCDWLDGEGIDRCGLVGTSFGGLVATRMALRLGRRVDALVLIDSVGFGRELPLVVRMAGAPFVGKWLLRPSRWGTRWIFRRLMTSERVRIDPELEGALVDYLAQSSRSSDVALLARAYRRFTSLAGQREVIPDDELRALRCRTLILWGERDRFLPVRHAFRAVTLISGAELRLIPDAGHSPNWEAPGEVVCALRSFLSVPNPPT